MKDAILGYSNDEVKTMIDEYVQSVIDDCELDITFIDSALIGSRIRGNARKNSDLDYVFEYSGDMKEYGVFNIMHDEPYYIDDVKIDINPIREEESGNLEKYLRKSAKYDQDVLSNIKESNIIKVNKAHTLNEDLGLASGITASTPGVDIYNSGFSYEIKPLTSNLSQKGNDPTAENRNKSFKHFVGDVIKGFCPYDKKIHKGMIKYLYYKDSESPVPMYVYIQDFSDESIIPLEADSIKNYKTIQIDNEKIFKDPLIQNPWQSRDTQIDHDFAAVASVKESMNSKKNNSFDFNI